MLIFQLQDVVFVEIKHDLRVDHENRQDGTTIPDIPGVVAPKLTYDINEWVGERLFFPSRHQDTSHSNF